MICSLIWTVIGVELEIVDPKFKGRGRGLVMIRPRGASARSHTS